MSLEQKIDDLQKQVASLESKLAQVGRMKVTYLTQNAAGIELTIPVERTGTLIATNLIPTGPGQLQPFFLVLSEDGSELVSTGAVKFIP